MAPELVLVLVDSLGRIALFDDGDDKVVRREEFVNLSDVLLVSTPLAAREPGLRFLLGRRRPRCCLVLSWRVVPVFV